MMYFNLNKTSRKVNPSKTLHIRQVLILNLMATLAYRLLHAIVYDQAMLNNC